MSSCRKSARRWPRAARPPWSSFPTQENYELAVESVKAASEVYAPVSGEVLEVNGALEGAPATVNEDAQGRGWFLKLKLADAAELDDLMTEDQYKSFLATLS